MQLRPRHYVLLAVIVGLFVFNIIRHRHTQPVVTPGPAPIVTTAPPLQTPAWTAFDHAASLRDAPEPAFQPAMSALQQRIHLAPSADLNGCLTWLEFYRQGALHPSIDPAWKQRSQRHLDGCVQFHLDTATP
jgi:hypothetical protein